MPVRKGSRRGGSAIGRFPSLKMGRMIAFESLLERDFIYLLDFDPSVDWFDEQPPVIETVHEGKQLHYTPDFHLMERGRHVLVECKQEGFVETDKNLSMYAATQDLCDERGWEFRIVNNRQVRAGFRLHNVKFLTQYARQKVDPIIRSQIHACIQNAQSNHSIQDVALAILPTHPEVVTGNILHLAYHHEINLPLDEAPISSRTRVARSASGEEEQR
jgi:hypothetical protein